MKDRMKKRCVITGLGLICSVGNNTNECWDHLIHGVSGIREVRSVNTDNCISHLGGEVVCDNLPAQEYDRSVQLCVKAAQEAIADAKLNKDQYRHAGVVIGSCVGGVVSIDDFYTNLKNGVIDADKPKQLSASSIVNNIASYLGCDGITDSIVNACAAGTMSIAHACDLISSGEGSLFLAGGTDAFSSLAYSGFNALHALSAEACSPFNKSNGITLGEGSGMLVVEEYEHAVARGAKIYCEVSGYGVSSDAFHITAPHPQGEGQMNAIKKAMRSAGIEPSEIGYINAHGTGTGKNDVAEFLSLHTLFDGTDLSVSSTKSMTGHCLGAAGAIEAVITVKSLEENLIPPTIGYSDEQLAILAEKAGDLDFVANTARKKELTTAMSNSFAFGGTDASIIFSKKEHPVAQPERKRVFVTGIGYFSSNMDTPLPSDDPAKPYKYGLFADLKMLSVEQHGVKMGFYRKLDHFSLLQLITGIDALQSSIIGVPIPEEKQEKVGIIIGTADGPATEITTFQQAVCNKGTASGSAFSFPNTVYNAAGGYLSIFTKAKGYCATIANGTQAGLQSIAYACDVLQKGDEDVIIAAGNDENSQNVSELYDCIAPKAKYYLGEASSCLALETEESFRKRQHEPVIHLFAEVAGYACNHTTDEANAKENLASAIQTACKRAGVTPDQIEMVYSCIEEATTLTQDDLKEILPEAKQVQLIERDGNGRAGLANRSAAEAVEAIDCGYCHISMAVASSFGSYTAVVFTEAK